MCETQALAAQEADLSVLLTVPSKMPPTISSSTSFSQSSRRVQRSCPPGGGAEQASITSLALAVKKALLAFRLDLVSERRLQAIEHALLAHPFDRRRPGLENVGDAGFAALAFIAVPVRKQEDAGSPRRSQNPLPPSLISLSRAEIPVHSDRTGTSAVCIVSECSSQLTPEILVVPHEA